jgi:hypothetical protein
VQSTRNGQSFGKCARQHSDERGKLQNQTEKKKETENMKKKILCAFAALTLCACAPSAYQQQRAATYQAGMEAIATARARGDYAMAAWLAQSLQTTMATTAPQPLSVQAPSSAIAPPNDYTGGWHPMISPVESPTAPGTVLNPIAVRVVQPNDGAIQGF